MVAYLKSTIKVPSATPGWNLDTWRYTPQAPESSTILIHPVVIMAHGFSATKLMSLTEYAEAFASIGYAVLVFDYRRWGASDGTPRHLLSVRDQLEDYRTVIKYARQQPEFDAQRVILWGSSFSGGHVITLSSEPELNIHTAVAQCPFTGTATRSSITSFVFLRTLFYVLLDAVKQALGMKPLYIPAGAEPGHVGALTAPGTCAGLKSICKAESDYANEVSASSLLSVASYDPSSNARRISCPLLVVAPTEDNLCLLPGAQLVAQHTTSCELLEVPGGHFEVYPGSAHHAQSLEEQVAFLRKHVPA